MRLISILILAIVLFAPELPARAQTAAPTRVPVSDDAVNAVSHNLYCPVCQNTPLDVCPTEACARWREQVRELLGQGLNEQQVRQYFIDHFGMRTVGEPIDTTSRVLTVLLPLGLIGLVGLAAVLGILSRRRSSVEDPIPEPVAPDEYRARLEDELKDL